MSLASYKPTALPSVVPETPSVVANLQRTEIYDHAQTPLWSLDAYLQGSPWEITYYIQRLGQNQSSKALDLNVQPSGQSYERIEKLQALLQGSITSGYDGNKGTTAVTGEMVLYSFMKPNVDDMFVAESNIARKGLFRVTAVNRRTHEKDSVWLVEFEATDELTPNDPRLDNLAKKSTVVKVFSRQRMIENLPPLLLKESHDQILNLRQQYRDLTEYYFRTFFQKPYNQMYLPGQKERNYDPFLMKFLLSIVSSMDAPEIRRMGMLSLNNGKLEDVETFWRAMELRSKHPLDTARIYMGRMKPTEFYPGYFGRTAHYGAADYILIPMFQDGSVQSGEGKGEDCGCGCGGAPCDETSKATLFTLLRTCTARGGHVVMSDAFYPAPMGVIPVFAQIHSFQTYIFPETFYQGKTNTLIEILTMDYLRGAPINLNQLAFMLDYYFKLERLEQFYYGPILMAIMKQTERGSFT